MLAHLEASVAYSVEEFAQAVGLSRNHAYALIRGGEIRAVKAGSRWIIPVKSVERWLEGQDNTDASSRA